MMRWLFDLRVIPHKKQRYPTVGDYNEYKGSFVLWGESHKMVDFTVSRMKDRRCCWLVFLHEIIEWTICKLTKVSMKSIDKFDMEYEKNRGSDKTPCGCRYRAEAGDDRHAPYFYAHLTATECERRIAEALGVDWKEYNKAVEAL